jgi:hypothetical protein
LLAGLKDRVSYNSKHQGDNQTMDNFTIDMPTVLFFLFFGNIIMAVLLAIYPPDRASRRNHRQFLAGKLLQSLAWILLARRGHIPDFYSAHVGNSFLLAGLALEALAIINVDKPKKHWEFFTRQSSAFLLLFLGYLRNKPINMSTYHPGSRRLFFSPWQYCCYPARG